MESLQIQHKPVLRKDSNLTLVNRGVTFQNVVGKTGVLVWQ